VITAIVRECTAMRRPAQIAVAFGAVGEVIAFVRVRFADDVRAAGAALMLRAHARSSVLENALRAERMVDALGWRRYDEVGAAGGREEKRDRERGDGGDVASESVVHFVVVRHAAGARIGTLGVAFEPIESREWSRMRVPSRNRS
jgi:hypothetical protein